MPTPITKCVSMFMSKKILWAIDYGANYFNMEPKNISSTSRATTEVLTTYM